MTPDEARALLDGTTPGPWEWASGKDSDVEYDALRGPGGVNALRTQDAEEYASWVCGTNADKALAAAAPSLAAMIAGMREEWSRQARITGDPEWHPIRWCRSREEAERTYWTRSLPSGATVEYRVVPRYILEPETTEG